MTRFTKFAALAAILCASGAQAAPLFSDSLTTTLASSNWIGNSSGQIVTAPTGGKALNFAANIGGGDLFSKVIAGTGVGTFTLRVDYLCQNANGCAGFIGLHPGGQISTTPYTQGYDNWLVTDAPQTYPTAFTFATSAAGFTHNSFTFKVDSAQAFGLKLEDFTGGAGDAYFKNLSLTAGVPEPASWALMLGGFGLLGGAVRRRRSTMNTVFA